MQPVRTRSRTRSKVCLFLSRLHTRTVSHVVGQESRYSFSETHAAARVVVARGRADVAGTRMQIMRNEQQHRLPTMALAEALATLAERKLAKNRTR